ncbi:alpha-terpineol synthase, chloroplastic [Triticum aestivum]|uniref:alpha-terpineol synthase, chloroplastic n=1 Tax=Triticum aestivum TaxID=4565 RepID=UPI001D001C52|nr:alpha-terpineol synthase, chloroplastic-like [Triticum aestivum]
MQATVFCSGGARGCRLGCLSAARPAGGSPSRRWQRPRHAALRCRQRQAPAAEVQHEVDDRSSRNPCGFYPSVWGDFFLHHSDPAASSQKQTWMVERVEELMKDVSKLISSSTTYLERMNLIVALERLCLDYLFEKDINVELKQIYSANVSDFDLHTVAIWFYLLRKHGYMVSPDVFVKFLDEDGTFLTATPRELLSLYNAAHFSIHGEIILDKAISFTKRSLESKLPYLEGLMAHEIQCALEICDIPLPRRVAIYDVKIYISTYEKEATLNKSVLELAKVNFNLMQLQYQQELKVTTRWWNNLQVHSRLPFARDRLVECYLWMLGVYYQPNCSRGRIILTFVIYTTTIIDDIYDSFGTSEECELFTEWVERSFMSSWDPKVAHVLPKCMQYALEKIMDCHQIIDNKLAPEDKYRMTYLRNFVMDLVRNYNKEVKMREENFIPRSVEEHLQVSARTCACHLLACTSLVGMDDIATKDSFEWISTVPKIVQKLCIIVRLLDDIMTYEREQMTPHVASTMDSYMKQHNVSIEIARHKIQELKEESWKDFNGEWLEPDIDQPRKLIEAIFNLTRTMEFMYNKDDNFTNCSNLKDIIQSLFVETF